LIKVIAIIALVFFITSAIPFFFITLFLTFNLRGRKYFIINDISNKAPPKFRERARFLMESNPSWIFASSAGHTWYSYIMLRHFWKISKYDIEQWHKEIKEMFFPYHKLYKLNIFFINLLLISLPILILFVYLYKI
jgi:hypothetical protein